jgi:hypothetical protein
MTTSQKRSAAENLSPLQQVGILKHVLDFVGPGHWCFVAEVSKLWRELYLRVADAEMLAKFGYDTITCVPEMTLFSAAFAAPSRLRYAHARGISGTIMRYSFAAGKYADIATLEVAHELGMKYNSMAAIEGAVHCNDVTVVQFLHGRGCCWTNCVFSIAARRGDMELCEYLYATDCGWSMWTCEAAADSDHASILRWLREHDCPWDEDRMHTDAAEGGSVDVMLYLQEQGIVFDADMLVEMLNIAGAYNNLAAAKWSRQQGAEWPEVLCYRDQKWPVAMLDWAGPAGCTSQLVLW